MKTLTITWELAPGDPTHVTYYVDNSPVGEDNSGFDRILDMVRSHKDAQVTLKIHHVSSLGGRSLTASLPFGERFNELIEELGERKIIYQFS